MSGSGTRRRHHRSRSRRHHAHKLKAARGDDEAERHRRPEHRTMEGFVDRPQKGKPEEAGESSAPYGTPGWTVGDNESWYPPLTWHTGRSTAPPSEWHGSAGGPPGFRMPPPGHGACGSALHPPLPDTAGSSNHQPFRHSGMGPGPPRPPWPGGPQGMPTPYAGHVPFVLGGPGSQHSVTYGGLHCGPHSAQSESRGGLPNDVTGGGAGRSTELLESSSRGPPDNHYTGAFVAVPPPSSLESPWSGRRRGKGKGGHRYGDAHGSVQDGLSVMNIPLELNTLDILNRHFRQFGEVLKITVNTDKGSAFVQFAERSAAEAALAAPVLDKPEIRTSWVQRSKGRGKAGPSLREEHRSYDRNADNRVLVADPEEQRRIDESRQKRDEIAARRQALLGTLTEQMKTTMAKLNDPAMSEARRESLQSLLFQMKQKMDELSVNVPVAHANGVAPSSQQQLKVPAGTSRQTWHTLDLRTKVLRVNLMQSAGVGQESWTLERLREVLHKFDAVDEQIQDIQWESGLGGPAGVESVLVRFKERWAAEHVFQQRGELPFYVEWCDPAPPSPETTPKTGTSLSPQLEAAGAGEWPDALPPSGVPVEQTVVGSQATWAVDLSEEEDMAG